MLHPIKKRLGVAKNLLKLLVVLTMEDFISFSTCVAFSFFLSNFKIYMAVLQKIM